MELDHLKKYIDENKSLTVSEELKAKTLRAAEEKSRKEPKDQKIFHFSKAKIKQISAAAACFVMVAAVLSGLFFNGLPGLVKNGKSESVNSSAGNQSQDGDSYSNVESNEGVIHEEIGTGNEYDGGKTNAANTNVAKPAKTQIQNGCPTMKGGFAVGGSNDNQYKGEFIENPVIKTSENPVSTFSIDVDTASYVNFRRYISGMSLKEFQKNGYTIRTEEAVNYFKYDYAKPSGSVPLAVTTSVGDCSWNSKAKLASITLAGRDLAAAEQKGSNIVFLIDVSGSMFSDDKLPLLKKSLANAVENLNDKDTVSIVTYASGVKTVLSGVKGSDKSRILKAINSLQANGSTAGADGLRLAYSVAEDYFIKGGNNRILISTDGDFNVGPSSIGEMKELVTVKRESGIFLTVLGFGVDYNSGDGRLEVLADNGNGGYYVIDCIEEGVKVLCEQFSSVLYTVAKDVKLQVEFNASSVESYRLIGYENRILSNDDFSNDKVDAGELGAGQTVTALYEIVLKNDDAKDLFKVKVRYKNPDSSKSELYEHTAQISEKLSDDFYFASAVAEACLVINNSKYKGSATLGHAYEMANEFGSNSPDKSRPGFIKILKDLIS